MFAEIVFSSDFEYSKETQNTFNFPLFECVVFEFSLIRT